VYYGGIYVNINTYSYFREKSKSQSRDRSSERYYFIFTVNFENLSDYRVYQLLLYPLSKYWVYLHLSQECKYSVISCGEYEFSFMLALVLSS
jgi:hypothetical protein